MNGKQRVDAVLKGEWPDKRPIILHNFPFAARDMGITMKQYRENPEIAAQAHIRAIEKYDLDGALFDIDTATLAGAVGVGVDFPEDEIARAHTPCLRSLNEISDLHPVDISKDHRVQVWLEACTIIKRYFGDEKFIRGNCDQAPFTLASIMRSPNEFMTDLLSEDERVFKLLEYCADISGQFIRLMAKTGVDMVANGDSMAGPELISAEMYEIFALPYEKEMIKIAHQLKVPYMLHICGNAGIILDKMVSSGADAVEIDYKTDLKLIYEKCTAAGVVLSGNIEPSGVLAMGSSELVEKKVKELLIQYKDSPRLIVNAGCTIPANTPVANIIKLVEVSRNFIIEH